MGKSPLGRGLSSLIPQKSKNEQHAASDTRIGKISRNLNATARVPIGNWRKNF